MAHLRFHLARRLGSRAVERVRGCILHGDSASAALAKGGVPGEGSHAGHPPPRLRQHAGGCIPHLELHPPPLSPPLLFCIPPHYPCCLACSSLSAPPLHPSSLSFPPRASARCHPTLIPRCCLTTPTSAGDSPSTDPPACVRADANANPGSARVGIPHSPCTGRGGGGDGSRLSLRCGRGWPAGSGQVGEETEQTSAGGARWGGGRSHEGD